MSEAEVPAEILARRAKCREYYQKHRTQILAHKKEYHQNNKEHRSQYMHSRYIANRETILAKQKEAYRKNHPQQYTLDQYDSSTKTASEYLTEQMAAPMMCDHHKAFVQMLHDKGIDDESFITELYEKASKAHFVETRLSGQKFEAAVKNVLESLLNDTEYVIHPQLPLDTSSDTSSEDSSAGPTCYIDFVITKGPCDRESVDLSQAIIISAKLRAGTQWREDMHLYSRCKGYVLLTLVSQVPTEAMPDNVRWCSPNCTVSEGKKLALNDLLEWINEVLA